MTGTAKPEASEANRPMKEMEVELTPTTGLLSAVSALAGAASMLVLGLVKTKNQDRQSLTSEQNQMIRTLWEQTQTQAALIQQMQSAQQQIQETHQETLEARAKAHRRDMDALRALYEQRVTELEAQLAEATKHQWGQNNGS